MRKAKSVSFCILLLAILLTFAVSANAAWYTCTIDMIGSTTSTPIPIIRLTDTDANPGFKNIWFLMRGDQSKQMLATALTAVNSGKEVTVQVTGIENYSDLISIYLRND